MADQIASDQLIIQVSPTETARVSSNALFALVSGYSWPTLNLSELGVEAINTSVNVAQVTVPKGIISSMPRLLDTTYTKQMEVLYPATFIEAGSYDNGTRGWVLYNAENATIFAAVGPASSTVGTLANADQDDANYTSLTTTTTLNNAAYMTAFNTTTGIAASGIRDFFCRVRTPSDISTIRLLIGMTPTTLPVTIDSPAGADELFFRYSTNASDAGWKGFIRSSGSTLGGNNTISIATSTSYDLLARIYPTASNFGATYDVSFYINGVLLETITNVAIPSNGNTALYAQVTTLTTAARSINFNRMYVHYVLS